MAEPCETCSSSSASLNKKLLRAVCQNHGASVKSLLKSGADVNSVDDTGATPLITAFEKEIYDVIPILIEAGANVNLRNCNGETALTLASRNGQEEWTTVLLEKGANVNEKNLDGDTALLLASKNEHAECVSVLIKAGANVNMRNYFGDSPLKIAFASPNIQYDMVQWFSCLLVQELMLTLTFQIT